MKAIPPLRPVRLAVAGSNTRGRWDWLYYVRSAQLWIAVSEPIDIRLADRVAGRVPRLIPVNWDNPNASRDYWWWGLSGRVISSEHLFRFPVARYRAFVPRRLP